MNKFLKAVLTQLLLIIITIIATSAILLTVIFNHTFEIDQKVVTHTVANEIYTNSQHGVLTVLNQELVDPENIYEYLLTDGEEYEQTLATGSGFVYKQEGDTYYALTNYHVIQGNDQVSVYPTPEGSNEVPEPEVATIVGFNEQYDVAVLSFQTKLDIEVLDIADSSEITPGEQAYAMGSPFGEEFAGSITEGIVSAPIRELYAEDGNTYQYIQTDAAINPGNSGGPLLNEKGEVIGMNSLKISSEESDNIGLAIPSNKFMEIANQIELDAE